MRLNGRAALKWGLAAFALLEWYSRGGREFLFGDAFDPDEGFTTLRLRVTLPAGFVPVESGKVKILVHDKNGDPVGEIVEVVEVDNVRVGGKLMPQHEARVEYDRAMFGWPINVAISEAEELTVRALALSKAANLPRHPA